MQGICKQFDPCARTSPGAMLKTVSLFNRTMSYNVEENDILKNKLAKEKASVTNENPIIIEDREELIYMLSEAASLEHMIMCQYLFAAFSLKRDTSEGVTAAQLEAITRWEHLVSLVATQEMLHLTLVNNLLSSIGSIPFFGRPNFPQHARYYPRESSWPCCPLARMPCNTFCSWSGPKAWTARTRRNSRCWPCPNPAWISILGRSCPKRRILLRLGTFTGGLSKGSGISWTSTAKGRSLSARRERRRHS